MVDDPLSFELSLTGPPEDVEWHVNDSGVIRPVPLCKGHPAGACKRGGTLYIQIQDAMALAGWHFTTCDTTVGHLIGDGHREFAGKVLENTCKPAAPLFHRESVGYRRSVMQPAVENELWDKGSWNTILTDEYQKVHNVTVTFACGPADPNMTYCWIPSYVGGAEIVFDVTYDNQCTDDVWQCMFKHGVAFFNAKIPPRIILNLKAAGFGANQVEGVAEMNYADMQKTTAAYKYGQSPGSRVVRWSECVGFVTKVSGEMLHFSWSGLFSTLAGYSFLFSACLYVVKFVAVYVMKNKLRYSALVTQRSMDFSKLEDFENLHKKNDPENPGSSITDMILHDALTYVGKLDGSSTVLSNKDMLTSKELLTVLIGMEQRLTALDAAGHSTSGQKVFVEFLEKEEKQRLAARKTATKLT